MAGIVDVARLAGVSITTASRVLNNADYPVAPATRARVLEAARALQYSPSALARALVTRRSRIVGVLVGNIVDPYFAEIVRGVEDVARRAGYLVIVCNTDRDPATELRYVAALCDYRVEALIFVGGDFAGPADRAALARQLDQATQQGTVAVALAGDRAGLPAINIDHRAAAREMTEHLIQLGHRRIAFVGGPVDLSTARDRHAGFVDALAAAGLAPEVVVEGDFTYTSGLVAGRQILAEHAPTAIFAANDQMALGVLAAARAAGRAVPADLTVIGFGDTEAAQHAVPALTTVSIPRHQLGVVAMEAILDAINAGNPAVASRQLPYQIVIRESSAPPLSTSA